MSRDYIIRAVSDTGSIRAFAAYTKNTVNTAQMYHKTSAVATAAVGRLLTAAAMMGATLKGEEDIITIQTNGNGPIGRLIAVTDSKSRVKVCVGNPNVELPLNSQGKLDVGGAVGKNGYLTVITDLGLKEPYIGKIPLVSGEIGDDLTSYFAVSDQIPSAVGLGVLVDTDLSVKEAGGFIIQVMPGASDDEITILENNVAKVKSVTSLLDEGKTIEEILALVLDGIEYHITDNTPTEYYCNCSRERVEKTLITIGAKDLREIIETDGKAQLTCHFCDGVYDFDKEDLLRLLAEATK
ncbi:MAG: Hsp33 family molecular chaperone HslO [Clostridia bacterium]|nr:Hsp33 family molecular chaperone HslO [Clostridia bacterium]